MYSMYDQTHSTDASYGNTGTGMTADRMPNPLAFRFLNEPLWRWFVFTLALGFLLHAWRGVIGYMK